MKIRDKTVLVYDIEIFPNVFHCVVKNTETKKRYFFEISSRKNDLSRIIEGFYQIRNPINWSNNYNTSTKLDTEVIFCGYNNIHYDNPVINYIIDNRYTLLRESTSEICYKLFKLSQEIVTSGEGYQNWHKWKYMIFFDTLDLLTMLYSQKLRVGLKEMQVTMQYPNVQEYDGNFEDFLAEEDIPKMIEYNINDVDSTEELLYKCKADIDLRVAIEDEYGVKVLNKDGVNIGMKIITQKYLEKTGQTWNDIKDLRSPCDMIPLKDVILPIISFKTPLLQDILAELKEQVVSPGRKGYEKHFLLENTEYTIGVGGLHTVNKPEKIIPQEGEIISDIDVASLYPSMIIEHEFYPKHLGREFLEVYSSIKEERIEAKHNGNTVKNLTLKLALNGLSGNLQNENNFCYSPFTVMQIRMNGQLMLLMLAERLIEIGCRILQANTDGLFVIRKLADDDKFEEVCKEWESLTKLVLEEDRFEAFYQFAINDYLAIGEGYRESKNPKLLKKKGLFIDKVTLGKGMKPIIIPEAINKFFADGVPVEQTILECKDILKFLTYQKIGKQFEVEYNNNIIQRINRYYMSATGYNLYKRKKTDNGYSYSSVIKDSGIIILNNLKDIDKFPTNINYNYYIAEAKKIISSFLITQLSLF